ncbi:MarR family winged helix-turn-helix transcriptional regulator [Allokutzneria albata]|uniref:DNA-binding transcriptional regulator, MarR family n=1 Tax=Allokutzneria albata TaxID=211114 RepID=A0A1G9S4M1_ALLAB|nr:MarR family transcriptional regulator [Allokutzneria albata]SDM29695.1 DNA-binding transcriptional regulator, MarR family [Allokutzneria albata]
MSDRVDRLIASWRTELPEALGPTSELVKRVLLLAGDLDAATRRELPEFELTTAEFDVLVGLRRSGAPYRLKPSELGRSLLLSSGGTSNIITRLTARGLVRRESDPDDGRGTLIVLTDAGKELAERAVLANSAAHAEVFAALPEATLRAATAALREVFAVLDAPRRR